MKNRTMTTLRDGLMDVLDGLMNKDKPLDPEIAKTYAAVAQVVVNSIKEEIAFMKATGGKGTGFIPEITLEKEVNDTSEDSSEELTENEKYELAELMKLPSIKSNVTVHRQS